MLSNTNIEIKLGRNDKCFCGSSKKYKSCCLGKTLTKYLLGQSVSSPIVSNVMETFRTKHPNHVFIDITDDLTTDIVYRDYQIHNIQSNIVMIAERKPHNESVFLTRIGDEEANVIVMYRGAYRTFCHSRMDYFVKSISNMIE